ncbi:endoribonuclease MazF [Helicobacter sp. 23-1045]
MYIPEYADIIWLDFNPQNGHEQMGKRPAVVLSAKSYNAKSGLCVCVPITSKIKGYPFEVPCAVADREGAILSDQIKSMDFKARNAKFIKKCDKNIIEQIKKNIALLLQIY